MSAQPIYRAGAIGHTGAGNFGHRLHLPFQHIDRTEMVAVADPDPEGRAAAANDSGAANSYGDYREMLAKEQLDIVSVCPRWAQSHEELLIACLEAGCHVFCEKPLAPSLDAADRMVDAAERTGRKVALAHQGVYLPQIHELKRQLADGRIGRVLAVHITGKQDRRGGGEDMLVLGTHQYNMARFFFGDVAWISARVLADGHELTAADVREVTEQNGPVAGNDVRTAFSFQSGVWGTYTSRADQPGDGACFGLEVVGEQGRIGIPGNNTDIVVHDGVYAPWSGADRWQSLGLSSAEIGEGNRLAILDLIDAIDNDRDPVSSIHDGRAALELILSAYDSQISGGRVMLPNKNRTHPLQRLRG